MKGVNFVLMSLNCSLWYRSIEVDMDQAPLGIKKVREERINSNMERMKQFGILNLSLNVNSTSKKKRIDSTPSLTYRYIFMKCEM